jgi:hypothetical protein
MRGTGGPHSWAASPWTRLKPSGASITLDVYGHLIPSLQAEAAEKIDELVTPVAVEFDRKKIGS